MNFLSDYRSKENSDSSSDSSNSFASSESDNLSLEIPYTGYSPASSGGEFSDDSSDDHDLEIDEDHVAIAMSISPISATSFNDYQFYDASFSSSFWAPSNSDEESSDKSFILLASSDAEGFVTSISTRTSSSTSTIYNDDEFDSSQGSSSDTDTISDNIFVSFEPQLELGFDPNFYVFDKGFVETLKELTELSKHRESKIGLLRDQQSGLQ